MPIQQILRLPAVSTLVGLARSTIYAKLDPSSDQYDPTFPRPLKLSMRAIGWREGDIEAWIESRTVADNVAGGANTAMPAKKTRT